MDTPDSLYAELLKNPDENSLRAAIADALEERAGDGDDDRARFVRGQLRLHQIGPRRPLLEDCVVATHGPRCYSVSLGDKEVKVGDRVDVGVYNHRRNDPKKIKDKTLHGLRVTRMTPDTYMPGATEVVLVEDGDSTPFPRDEYDRIREDCREIFSRWSFGLGARGVPETFEVVGLRTTCVFERGFLSVVKSAWNYFRQDARTLFGNPITRVVLEDIPEYQSQDRRADAKHEFALTGHAGSASSVRGQWADEVMRQCSLRHAVPLREWHSSADQLGLARDAVIQLLRRCWPTVPEGGWVLPD